MVRFLRFGFVVLVLAGLTACSAKANAPKSVVINDFERVPDAGLLKRQFDPAEALKKPTYPNHDFDVATSGYAAVTSINKEAARAAKDKPLYKFIQGKTAAQVRFTVPTDYRKKNDDRFPKTWETGFGMSTDSHTPLAVTDWSAYKYFDFRVFNPGAREQTLFIRYNDAASSTTLTTAVIPKGESEVELPLDALTQARLNLAQMRGFTLYLDTAAQDSDPVLLFDQLALYDTDAATRVKLAAEEGEQASEDEDWDSEDEDTVRKVNVVHAGPAQAQAQAVSGPASAQ